MKEYDLTDELYREYDLGTRNYKINKPLKLFVREGGTTHRVLDSDGIVHCIPFPAPGVVLRWAPRDCTKPVAF